MGRRRAASVDGCDEAGFAPARLALRRRLPWGRHHLWVETDDGPGRRPRALGARRCPQPDGRWWGVFAPLYALRAEDDWGVGSFSELARFRGWIDGLGGSVAATLPLFAQFLDEPMVEPSPYSPASRLFWNETYIDVTTRPRTGRMRRGPRGARRPVLRRTARPPAQERPHRPPGDRRGEATRPRSPRATDVRGHATGRLARVRVEPASRRLRAVPRGGGAARGLVGRVARTEREGSLTGSALEDDRARYHLFVQWLAAEQLSEAAGRASAAGGLMLDLPIGVNGAGYDVWRERDSFVPDVAAGAPPDAFWSQGQDWGLPRRIRTGPARPATATTTRSSARCSAMPRSHASIT